MVKAFRIGQMTRKSTKAIGPKANRHLYFLNLIEYYDNDNNTKEYEGDWSENKRQLKASSITTMTKIQKSTKAIFLNTNGMVKAFFILWQEKVRRNVSENKPHG